jgi:WD40 repeat protein
VTANVWNPKTGKGLFRLVGHTLPLTSAAFSPSGRYIVTTSTDTDARLWNARTGALVNALKGHSGTVSAAAFSADEHWVATVGLSDAGIWEVRTGTPVVFAHTTDALLTSIAFSPHGWRIVTGGRDGSVRTYDCLLCGGRSQLVALAKAKLRELTPQ